LTRLHLVQGGPDRRERRDSLGRRIGYNWWREFIWGEWRCAYDAWLMEMQHACLGYGTEEREHRYNNPSPKFKDFLIEHAGQHVSRAA
jgi:hypothetical protein